MSLKVLLLSIKMHPFTSVASLNQSGFAGISLRVMPYSEAILQMRSQ